MTELSSQPSPRRRLLRLLKISAVVLAVCVLTPAAYTGWITASSTHQWSTFEKQLEQGISARNGRDGARTPIGGIREKGNAWEEYELEFTALDPRHGYESPFPKDRDGFAVVTEAAGALEGAAAMMDRFAKAACRERAARTVAWGHDIDEVLESREPCQNAANLLLADAWQKWRSGDFDGALGRYETVMQLALDASRPRAIDGLPSIHLMETTIHMMSTLAVDPRATEAHLKRIEAMLLSAEDQLPAPEEAFEGERWEGGARLKLIVEGKVPVETPSYAEKESRWKSVARRGFSIKGAAIEVARHQERAVELARETRTMPWDEARRAWSTFDKWEEQGNPLVHSIWLGYSYYCWAERGCRARFRLLRVACMKLRKDTSPLPTDPITLKPFESYPSTRSIIFRTPGPDHWGYGSGAFKGTGDGDHIMISVPLR